MLHETIRIDIPAPAVMRITLDRPEVLNALNQRMGNELQRALYAIRGSEARCLIITATGRGFCSGADLAEGAEDYGGDVGPLVDRGMNPIMETLFALDLPVITAVNGVAAGAGCSLALAGDLVVAAEEASFLQAFVNVGLVPDAGASWLLPRAIGRARAMEMMLLARKVDGRTALEWGLINRLVTGDALQDEALALAIRLADGPTVALAAMRHNVRRALDGSLSDALQYERQAQSRCGDTADFREAVSAFSEKRKPVFQGR